MEKVLWAVTDCAIISHKDDGEIGCLFPIVSCYPTDPSKRSRGFLLIVVTDGAGSPTGGRYAETLPQKMAEKRWDEQKAAAMAGQYLAVLGLGFSSREVKDPVLAERVVHVLLAILLATRPKRIYTHNLADAHKTHVSTALRVLQAIRLAPPDARPPECYGVEVWRALDWLPKRVRKLADVSGWDNLIAALIGVMDSQIASGKKYHHALLGRLTANATFADTHELDKAEQATLMMNMTTLVTDDSIDPADFVRKAINEFCEEVTDVIKELASPRDVPTHSQRACPSLFVSTAIRSRNGNGRK